MATDPRTIAAGLRAEGVPVDEILATLFTRRPAKADVPTTGKRPRPCNAVFCRCKWLLFQMRRENAALRKERR